MEHGILLDFWCDLQNRINKGLLGHIDQARLCVGCHRAVMGTWLEELFQLAQYPALQLAI